MKKLIFGGYLLLVGCTSTTTSIISTNNFIQTNYIHDCLNENNSFTEIILCYQKQDASEKMQNNLTNELLLETEK